MHPRLTLNLGVRYEIDTDVNNISRVDQLNPIVAPFVTGPRHRDTNNFGPRARIQLVRAGFTHQHPRRLRHLLRSRHARDRVARAWARRPGAADRGSRRQSVVHRRGDRPRAAVRADRLESVHRIHPARRRRFGHQHHRSQPAEPDGPAGFDRRRTADRRRGRSCASTWCTTTAPIS